MNTATEGEVIERELPSMDVEATGAALINASEINQQIATARRYPRSLKAFRDEALQMVTLTEAIAQECIYALPRDGKIIEGPSARMAEVLASAWGNCRAGARVIDDHGEFVTAQGGFHDLQKNVSITYEVKRRIVDKQGRRYKPDMIGVTANAACSIALRNAVLKGIPKAFWNDIYQAARRTIMGDFKTLSNRRAEALKEFQAFGVTEDMIYGLLEVRGKEDISIEHLVVLRGLLTAIKEGDTTVEQAFPPKVAGVGDSPNPRSSTSALKNAVSGSAKPNDAPAASDSSTTTGGIKTGSEGDEPEKFQMGELTVIDAIAKLAGFSDIDAMGEWTDALPVAIKQDDRFSKAFKKRMTEIKEQK